MPNTQLQEDLSQCVAQVLLYPKAWFFTKPTRDFGVDYTVSPHGTSNTGVIINIQLKSVKKSNITNIDGKISYKLEVKNYNQLIQRKKEYIEHGFAIPYLLVLCTLKDEEDSRVSTSENTSTIYHSTYWYIPSDTDDIADNSSSKTINIPQENLITSAEQFDLILREQYRIHTGREVL